MSRVTFTADKELFTGRTFESISFKRWTNNSSFNAAPEESNSPQYYKC